jgi:ABC-2 type transport system ATP-binding protein
MTRAVAEVRDLYKYFAVAQPLHKQLRAPLASQPRLCALRKVSLRVAPGEILGVIGPNGAGKTTLLRVLADLLDADEGWVAICGQRLTRKNGHIRRQIGYVSSDERSFFWRLTGRQNLEFFATLYGISRAKATKRIHDILDSFALIEKAQELFRDYSSGTRKKFAVARGLLHRPRIILLDEVTNSLDPPSARRVKSLVRDYVSSDPARAALWSTHRLEEIAEVCDKAIIMSQGQVDFFGPVGELTDEHGRMTDYPARPVAGQLRSRTERVFVRDIATSAKGS